jgi:outer membrane receptor protein involved in Fe transport
MTSLAPLTPRFGVRRVFVSLFALSSAAISLAQQTTPPPDTDAKPDEAIVLTPFTVDASKDKGYFAENTLAGSRLNTNISDLGASISVVTKQQMEDTASVDINDIFRYEINTEGSSTYTPNQATLRNDGLLDVNAGGSFAGGAVQTNATANRVRGIGVPSSAINYYPSIGQLPMDSYNVASLEISRGPNSMLFGMGSPAGIVNQSFAQAVLNRNTNSVSMRFDDRGSHRGTFSFNRSLIEDKLAIYGAVLYQDQRFERKPSYDLTRRQYAALTFKPFSKTVIRASVEGYNNDNRRPNSITPRDFVTQWNLAGRPMYDALTKTVTRTVNGQSVVSAPFIISAGSPRANEVRNYVRALPGYNPALRGTSSTAFNGTDSNFTFYNGVAIFGEAAMTNTLSSLYVPGINWVNQPRATMQIAEGSVQNYFQGLYGQRYRTGWGTATNPAANGPEFATEAQVLANPGWADIINRDYSASAGWTATYPGSYKYPGVTDQSIYDWENINVLQMNFGEESNTTYNIELEQELLSNLFLSAGWFRQDFDSVSNYTVAQLNAATLFVDTNKYLPNGQPNPYAGKVYMEDTDPDQAVSAEEHDHYRAMLAYTPDFTQKDGWMKWLGRHQILGLWSKQDSMSTYYRNRLHYIDSSSFDGKVRYMANQNNNADGSPTGWNRQTTSVRRAFYLAAPGDPDGVVTQSPGEWNAQTYQGDVTVYDYAANQFKPINVTQQFITHSATTGKNQREIESLSAGMTNYLWNDRLVTTFGVRKDDYRARATTNAAILDADKKVVEPAMTPQQQFVNGVYQTETVFQRWQRFDELSGTTRTMGGVFKPFKNWTSIERRANDGSFGAQFLRGFGISYNESDNFNAPAAAQVDGLGDPLPKPSGEGKDIGLQFSVLDDKLFARITWFEASNENERMNAGTAISRLTGNVDTTLFRNWARTIAKINMGMDPRTSSFNDNLPPAVEEAVRTAVEPIWKQAYLHYDNLGSIGATRNAEAKGVELSINYNPSPNWTMRFTGGKQRTSYSKVLTEFDQLYSLRNPIWQAAKAADYLKPEFQQFAKYTTSGGREVDLTNFWSSYGFDTNVRLDEPNGNFNVATYYNNVVAPQAALARDLDGQLAPNQRQYRWSFLTNYSFETDRLRGFFVGGSQRWEDKSIIGYFGRSSGANPDPRFLDVSDVTRPIYDDANYYTDIWVGYTRKIMNDKVRMRVQINVDNIFESGGLQVTQVNYDGSPYNYRIVDPRTYKLTATFDF